MARGAKKKGYIQDLSSKKLMSFIYNPEQLESSFSVDYARIKSPGASHLTYQYVGGNEQTFSVSLLIDGVEFGTKKVKDWMAFLERWNPGSSKKYTQFAPPPKALFSMGWFVKKCIITDVTYRIIMWDSALNPLRIEVDMSLEVIMV